MQRERERISKIIDNYCNENGEELFIRSGYFAHEDLLNLILQEKAKSKAEGVIEAKFLARPEVIEFAKDMEYKLKENDYKHHWSGARLGYLSKRLHKEVKELSRAIKNKPFEEIIKECADVANFAMMIANNCRKQSALKELEEK